MLSVRDLNVHLDNFASILRLFPFVSVIFSLDPSSCKPSTYAALWDLFYIYYTYLDHIM